MKDLGFERDVIQPLVTFGKDHLRFDFPPAGGLLAIRRTLIVPYSTIEDVHVDEAPWPHPLHVQRIGTHVPFNACFGTFWIRGRKNFYFFVKDDRVCRLVLADHPYSEIVIGMEEPDVLAADIKVQLEGSRGSETQSF